MHIRSFSLFFDSENLMFSAIAIIAFLFLNDDVVRNPLDKVVGNENSKEVGVADFNPDPCQKEGKDMHDMSAVLASSSARHSQTLDQGHVTESEAAIKKHNIINQALNVTKSVLIKDKVKKLMESIEQTSYSTDVSKSNDPGSEYLCCTQDSHSNCKELVTNIHEKIRTLERKVDTLIDQQERSLMALGTIISTKSTTDSTAGHTEQCPAINASHQELLKITAELSKAIKEQDLQTKRLAYKVSK
ncbi:hypothetical protein FB192DRAFT_1375316 [Mucor lusitanicus]|uniref:Uncharacterized protein n=1 Tax=Mucor circinelloides f. lusitanicus TaxID=29924 RepID=A0A8H4BGK1_MUCCL|nr:hypothetical protein FB192DRAFT_1375316 [Mucor lusitanicus]